jgi:type II secretory pathway pseudopilin PulG
MMWRPKNTLRIWECVAVLTILAVLALVLLPALPRARESSRRSSCANNLKQMGLVFKMYANEARGGAWPPVSAVANNWIPDTHAIYPEYLSDFTTFICPSNPYRIEKPFALQDSWEHDPAAVGMQHPDCVSSLYYNYTGYALTDDESALGLYRAVHARPWRCEGGGDIKVEINTWERSDAIATDGGPRNVHSALPVMWDRVPLEDWMFSHVPMGINVLHGDGHVEFVRYTPLSNASHFPATYIAAETFGNDVPRLSVDCY